MDRWLLVGALWAEVSPVATRLRDRRWLGSRLVVGTLAGVPVAVLRAGVGPDAASARTAQGLARWPADRVLSFGTCGAISDQLALGDVITGQTVATERGPRLALSALQGVPTVTIASVRAVVCTEARRSALAEAGFEICEMECAAVHQAAAGRPVYALKVVSDRAGADADPALPLSGIPSPTRLLRSQVRAMALVQRRLLPALERCLLQPIPPY